MEIGFESLRIQQLTQIKASHIVFEMRAINRAILPLAACVNGRASVWQSFEQWLNGRAEMASYVSCSDSAAVAAAKCLGLPGNGHQRVRRISQIQRKSPISCNSFVEAPHPGELFFDPPVLRYRFCAGINGTLSQNELNQRFYQMSPKCGTRVGMIPLCRYARLKERSMASKYLGPSTRLGRSDLRFLCLVFWGRCRTFTVPNSLHLPSYVHCA
eukprot:5139124-Amphidinium_carterae.1